MSEETKWISVSERLPEEHEKVLVSFGDQNILIGVFDFYGNWNIFYKDGINEMDITRPITNWQPLPEPPLS